MPAPAFLVGAYASLPDGREDQASYYRLLGEQQWIGGAEMPFPGDLAAAETRGWLAQALPERWHRNCVTAIPGTMRNVGKDPAFGLASPDEAGRQKAIEFFGDVRTAVADFVERRGAADVAFVEVHSAPTRTATPEALERSLAQLLEWEWCGAQLVLEHCDRFIEGQNPEKGFLPLEEEIAVCGRLGIGVAVNWGRSAVEGRDAGLPLAHIEQAAAAGVLRGVMFSGAGPAATQYGYEWIDGHLPMNPDEPTSIMGAAEVSACSRVAQSPQRSRTQSAQSVRAAATAQPSPSLDYLGAKVCVPRQSSLEERLAFLAHIHSAAVPAE